MLTLLDILQHYPEFQGRKVRLIRHSCESDKAFLDRRKIAERDRIGLSDLNAQQKLSCLRTDMETLEAFSSEYGKAVLGDADLVMAFVSTGEKSAEFLGAFNVLGNMICEDWINRYAAKISEIPAVLKNPNVDVHLHIPELGYSAQPGSNSAYYDVSLLPGDFVNEFRRRLIIEWKSPNSWSQKILDKEILAIRPKGFVREWNGFQNFILTFPELVELVNQESINSEWKGHLKSVAGIYAIQNTQNGRLYIGSAYSKDGGIWGRWAGYAKTKTNGNKELVELLENDPQAITNLQFSILKIMDIKSREQDVIAEESLLKRKLGSRKFGYNAN